MKLVLAQASHEGSVSMSMAQFQDVWNYIVQSYWKSNGLNYLADTFEIASRNEKYWFWRVTSTIT